MATNTTQSRIGYFLSSEELAPPTLVDTAKAAEQAGFDRIWVSDHYHPWTREQGESGFVWSMLGAIASATELHMTTAVTARLTGSILRFWPRRAPHWPPLHLVDSVSGWAAESASTSGSSADCGRRRRCDVSGSGRADPRALDG
jgi:hypothetical protein